MCTHGANVCEKYPCWRIKFKDWPIRGKLGMVSVAHLPLPTIIATPSNIVLHSVGCLVPSSRHPLFLPPQKSLHVLLSAALSINCHGFHWSAYYLELMITLHMAQKDFLIFFLFSTWCFQFHIQKRSHCWLIRYTSVACVIGPSVS
jgi:hypothetical protein